MSLLKEDRKYGLKNEQIAYDTIKKKYGNIQKLGYFDKYDFYNKDTHTYFELKSRRINSDTYATTMIPADKIEENKKIVFLFMFDDGLFSIEHNSDIFKTFEKKSFCRNDRNSENCDFEKYYVYIPIEKLEKID